MMKSDEQTMRMLLREQVSDESYKWARTNDPNAKSRDCKPIRLFNPPSRRTRADSNQQ